MAPRYGEASEHGDESQFLHEIPSWRGARRPPFELGTTGRLSGGRPAVRGIARKQAFASSARRSCDWEKMFNGFGPWLRKNGALPIDK